LVKQRLHQASFRNSVLAAYDHRCAISNLPDDHLLDAAHVMADAHELLGHPVVANGIALSKIHHAAFDNHLIGIGPRRPGARIRAVADAARWAAARAEP
jgi:putative restriction endonuclease